VHGRLVGTNDFSIYGIYLQASGRLEPIFE